MASTSKQDPSVDFTIEEGLEEKKDEGLNIESVIEELETDQDYRVEIEEITESVEVCIWYFEFFLRYDKNQFIAATKILPIS